MDQNTTTTPKHKSQDISGILPNTKFGLLFSYALIGLALLLFIGRLAAGGGSLPSLAAFITIAEVLIVGYWYYSVYKVHLALAVATDDTYPIAPNKVTAYHFIPFYNVYWIFRWPLTLIDFIAKSSPEPQQAGKKFLTLSILGYIFPPLFFMGLAEVNKQLLSNLSPSDQTVPDPSLKRRLTKTAQQLPKLSTSQLANFLKEAGIVIGIFLLLNSFVIASFEVPTGSMENEIMTGDFLLVNKFIYGGTTPGTMPPFQVLPILNIKLPTVDVPTFKLPSFWNVDKGDVIVFIFPGYRDQVASDEFTYYLKRCIATEGDTLEVRDRQVYVNNVHYDYPRNVLFDPEAGPVKPRGMVDAHIFPPGAPFNEDNYGPIVIPKKGMTIQLTPRNYIQWVTFIKREHHSITMRGGEISIDGKPATSYTVERDYVFGMGDHRTNSLDSRFWGFIPKEDVVGTPLIVYWSWNPDLALSNLAEKISTIRWSRIGTLVH